MSRMEFMTTVLLGMSTNSSPEFLLPCVDRAVEGLLERPLACKPVMAVWLNRIGPLFRR